MPADILEKVAQIAADLFQVARAQIAPDSSPDTIPAWDSLQHLNLVLALEQEFAIQFVPEEIEQMLSLEIIADLVAEKVKTCEVA